MFFRGTKVKFINLNFEDQPDVDVRETQELVGKIEDLFDATKFIQIKKLPQMFQVDGEGLMFTDFAKIQVVPAALDILVDFNTLMRRSNMVFNK